MESQTQSNFILVNTTNGTEVPKGYVLISDNMRETKGNTVTPETRYRNILIPEFDLSEVSDKFRSVLAAKMYELAKARLEVANEESNRMIRQLPPEEFTVSSLLEFFGRRVESNRLTGESVGLWFDASATAQKIKSKAPEKLQKFRDLFVKTASPNHGINPNTCQALLATLESSDVESSIGATLAGKWQATIEKSKASEVESL